MLRIDISNCQQSPARDEKRFKQAGEEILRDAGIVHAELSIAIVDDATIQPLNRRYLGHDYPTDVLSFLLERHDDHLEGEVIVSVETAAREAAEFGWTTEEELLLYVIHGTLHLVGHDDSAPVELDHMRQLEQHYLSRVGVSMPSGSVPRAKPAVGREAR
jgi:probable rRNA maturation factor